MRTGVALTAMLALMGAAAFLHLGKQRLMSRSVALKIDSSATPNLVMQTKNIAGAPESPARGSAPGFIAQAAPHDRAQLQTLNAVLSSGNDNDPRLDTELKELSPAAKALFQQKYASLPTEDRNGRGTIVFLLGRNITSESDVAFLHSVIQEEPCLNMANCKQPMRADDHGHSGETGMEVSLAYPQLMALKGLERLFQRDGNAALRADARETIHAATKSPTDKVAELARQLSAKINK